MAIKDASAALSVVSTILPITGFINYKQGILDSATGYIKPMSNSRWGSLSGRSWNSWTNFTLTPLPIVWTSDMIDNGEVRYFTLNLKCEADAPVTFVIHTSESGLFLGEEVEHILTEGDTDIPAFYGQYFYVTVRSEANELRRLAIESSNKTVEIFLQDVDTSTLGGTVSNRVLTLPRTVSSISEMAIHPKAATSYAVNLYVSDTPTSEVLIPVVKSKNGSSPSFAMYGIDNDPRDGIVDISIKALPRQALIGGSLYVL